MSGMRLATTSSKGPHILRQELLSTATMARYNVAVFQYTVHVAQEQLRSVSTSDELDRSNFRSIFLKVEVGARLGLQFRWEATKIARGTVCALMTQIPSEYFCIEKFAEVVERRMFCHPFVIQTRHPIS